MLSLQFPLPGGGYERKRAGGGEFFFSEKSSPHPAHLRCKPMLRIGSLLNSTAAAGRLCLPLKQERERTIRVVRVSLRDGALQKRPLDAVDGQAWQPQAENPPLR